MISNKLRLECNIEYAYLHGPLEVLEDVYKKFSIKDPGAFHIRRNSGRKWDGFNHFVSEPPQCRMKVGIAYAVANYLMDKGIACPIEWNLPPQRKSRPLTPEFVFPKDKYTDFFPEQWDVIKTVTEDNIRRAIWKCAPNSGKTDMAARAAWELGKPTLFVVDRVQLTIQTAERWSQLLGRSVGILGDSQYDIQDVTVATIQSLAARMQPPFFSHAGKRYSAEATQRKLRQPEPELYSRSGSLLTPDQIKEKWQQYTTIHEWVTNKWEVIVYDEIHKVKMKTWRQLHKKMKNAKYVIGLSGTPFRGKPHLDYKIVELCGDVCADIGPTELIQLGQSVPTHIIGLCYPDCPNTVIVKGQEILTENLEVKQVSRELIYYNQHRNELIVDILKVMRDFKLPTLVFTEFKKHISGILKAASGEDIKCLNADASVSAADRNFLLHNLANGHFDALVTTPIMDYGIDIPDIPIALDIGYWANAISTIQRNGRIQRRKTKGLKACIMVIILDKNHKKLRYNTREKLQFLFDYGKDSYHYHIAESVEELPHIVDNICKEFS